MASSKLKLIDLAHAIWRGLIDHGKVVPGAAAALGFLESIHDRCRELDKEAIEDLAQQARSIEMERIKTAVGDLRFGTDEIRKEVEDVTRAVFRHLADRGELPRDLEDIKQMLREVRGLAQQTLSTTQQTYDVAVGVQGAVARIETELKDGRRERGSFHAEIDRAGECLRERKPEAALVLLDDLRKRHWSDMDERERFRLEANTGHAYMRQGKHEDAARQFLRARVHQPDDEDAMQLAIRAKAVLEDWDEARQLADEARAKFPQSARVLGLWMHLHSDEMTFRQMEESLPTHMRDTYQVACALAEKAVNEQLLGEAERCARLATEAEPEEPYAACLLGQVILQRELDACKPGVSPESQVCRKRMEEALQHLTASIDAWGPSVTKESTLPALTTRGVVHSLLGRDDLAEQDLLRAYGLAPQDPEAGYHMASFRARMGNKDRAIEVLSSDWERKAPVKSHVLLAELLMERGRPGDAERARDVLQDCLEDWENWEDRHKVAYVGTMVSVLLLLGEAARCLRFLSEPPVDGLDSEARRTFTAKAQLENGEKEEALQTALEARENLTEGTDPAVMRELAWVFYKLGKYEEAKGLLTAIIEPLYFTNDTICLLECATKTGDDDLVVSFCERLRQNGVYDVQSVDAEVVTLVKYNAYHRAISILQDVIAESGDERLRKIARARLSQFAILAGERDLVEQDPEKLPSVEEAGPHYGRVATQALLHSDHPARAADFAYELYRQYPDEFEVCSAVVDSLGLTFHVDVPVEHPTEVGIGCAVQFRDEATGRKQWCIIEDAADTRPMLQEFPPTHPLCRAMMGKHVDEQFAMPNAERQGTVLQIADKRLYRWHECAQQMAQRHPDRTWIWTFDAAHDPELTHMTSILRSSRERIQDGVDLYGKQLLPVSFLERVTAKNTFQNVQIVAQQSPLPIRCSFGNAQEAAQAAAALSEAEALVVDVTGMATLFMLGRLRDVLEWPVELVITQGAWGQIREALSGLEHHSTHYAALVPQGGDERVAAIPTEDPTEARERLRSFCQLIKERVRIEGGSALLGIDRVCRDQLVEITGRPSAESIALAGKMGAVLWSDDCVVATFGARELHVQSAWTQAVFEHAARAGWTEGSAYTDVTFAVLGWGYRHTMITAELIREAVLRSEWRLDEAPLSHVLDQFANDESIPEGLLFLAGATIRWAWQHAPLHQHAEALTTRILERLASRKKGHQIIRALAASMKMLFGLDVINGQRARDLVEQWLRASRRISLP